MSRRDDKILSTLESVAWAEEHFGGLATNRVVTRRDVMSCVGLGLAESNGFGSQCDEDGGALHGRREVEGFVLTDAGRERLRSAGRL